jgi:CheY-like chemotaxis protein
MARVPASERTRNALKEMFAGKSAADKSSLRARPALIISDINMPWFDVFEFIALLRQERRLRDIPVILLSTEDEGLTRGKEFGVVRYVRKPVKADTLLSIIAEHVQGGEP